MLQRNTTGKGDRQNQQWAGSKASLREISHTIRQFIDEQVSTRRVCRTISNARKESSDLPLQIFLSLQRCATSQLRCDCEDRGNYQLTGADQSNQENKVGDSLHMMRLREHIKGTDGSQSVAPGNQFFQIAGKCCGIA